MVSQGRTLDELVDGLREAVELHLEGEDTAALGLVPTPQTRRDLRASRSRSLMSPRLKRLAAREVLAALRAYRFRGRLDTRQPRQAVSRARRRNPADPDGTGASGIGTGHTARHLSPGHPVHPGRRTPIVFFCSPRG